MASQIYNTRGILAADVRAAFATDYTREGQRVSSNQSISSRDAYAAKRRGIRRRRLHVGAGAWT